MKQEKNQLIYHNDFEKNLILIGFKSSEINIIATLLFKMLNKGTLEVTLSFYYLKKLINWKRTNNKEFIKTLENTYKKMIRLNFRKGHEKDFVKFILFSKYSISSIHSTLSIKVNEEFLYLLNDLTENFTYFELHNFTSLKSKYSKLIYKFLMRWKNKKQPIYLTIQNFRKKLDIPTSYRMTNIDLKVLKPIEEELSSLFIEFRIEKIKNGRNIVRFYFYFKLKSKIIENKSSIDNIKESEKVQDNIFKTDKNLKELVKLFEEINMNFSIKHKEQIKKILNSYSSSFILNHFKEQIIVLTNEKKLKIF